MSVFGIFALILTTAYIIYFAVLISRDIVSGRKKAENSPDSETFEISSTAQDESVSNNQDIKNAIHNFEESTAVIETEDGGFRIGDKDFETSFEPVTTPIISTHFPSKASSTEEECHEVLMEKSEEVEDSISNLKLGFEDKSNKFEYEEEIPSDEMETYICNLQSNSSSHLVHKTESAAEEPLESEADDGPELQAEQEEERDRM